MSEIDPLDEFLGHIKKDLQKKTKALFTAQKLDKGQFVFFEGDEASSLYLVESGVLEANVVHGDGKVFIFHFLFPGEVFGEGILYGQDTYPFSVVARSDARLLRIDKDELLPIIKADPSFENYMLQLVGQKLELAYVKARCIAGEKVEKRVACILLKTIEERGILEKCGERLDTPLTNRDISGLIGSTEETVSRIMSRLKKEGVIGTKDKQLIVLDREALLQYFDSV